MSTTYSPPTMCLEGAALEAARLVVMQALLDRASLVLSGEALPEDHEHGGHLAQLERRVGRPGEPVNERTGHLDAEEIGFLCEAAGQEISWAAERIEDNATHGGEAWCAWYQGRVDNAREILAAVGRSA